jgi:hypothetical protein
MLLDSSGSVVMMRYTKVCFPRGPSDCNIKGQSPFKNKTVHMWMWKYFWPSTDGVIGI